MQYPRNSLPRYYYSFLTSFCVQRLPLTVALRVGLSFIAIFREAYIALITALMSSLVLINSMEIVLLNDVETLSMNAFLHADQSPLGQDLLVLWGLLFAQIKYFLLNLSNGQEYSFH